MGGVGGGVLSQQTGLLRSIYRKKNIALMLYSRCRVAFIPREEIFGGIDTDEVIAGECP